MWALLVPHGLVEGRAVTSCAICSSQHGAFSGVGARVASFVPAVCPVVGGMWGRFGKPLKKAIWNTLGLHAVLTVCLRFPSGTKTSWSCFASENWAILGQRGFVRGPAFSHIGEIDPGPRLIFKPFSHRFQKAYPREQHFRALDKKLRKP